MILIIIILILSSVCFLIFRKVRISEDIKDLSNDIIYNFKDWTFGEYTISKNNLHIWCSNSILDCNFYKSTKSMNWPERILISKSIKIGSKKKYLSIIDV
jgi:hypothetical protein